jgi:hypothetical protein
MAQLSLMEVTLKGGAAAPFCEITQVPFTPVKLGFVAAKVTVALRLSVAVLAATLKVVVAPGVPTGLTHEAAAVGSMV